MSPQYLNDILVSVYNTLDSWCLLSVALDQAENENRCRLSLSFLQQNLISQRVGGKITTSSDIMRSWDRNMKCFLKIWVDTVRQSTNILVYNRCKRIKHLLSSQMPPVHCIWMSLFLKHYKDMADTLQVCQEIILQRQVFAIVSSLWRAVPFSFWRSTCPLGPWWDCRAPRWRGQSQGCVDALWKRLLFWADPIFPMEPNGRPVRDSWGC